MLEYSHLSINKTAYIITTLCTCKGTKSEIITLHNITHMFLSLIIDLMFVLRADMEINNLNGVLYLGRSITILSVQHAFVGSVTLHRHMPGIDKK